MVTGRLHPAFAEVAWLLDRFTRRPGTGGAVAIYHDGELVADIWSGEARPGVAWDRDTVAMSFSTTKGVVATAAHRLAHRGLLDVDAPVAEYWPEFAAAGKGRITVGHLLSHGAGMHRIRGVLQHAAEMLDWEHATARLAAAPAAWPPGTHHGYHALTFGWLVGEVVRRAAGTRTVGEAVAREVCAPLRIDELAIGAPPGAGDRVATLTGMPHAGSRPWRLAQQQAGQRARLRHMYDAFFVPGIEHYLTAESLATAEVPAVNGMFTARALARMYDAAGRDDDFLAPDVRARATAVQTHARDVVVGVALRWRLGYHLVGTTRGLHPRAFGHFGFGGSGAWYDPDTDVAFAFVTNRIGGLLTPFADSRIVRLGGAALRGARRRR